MREELLPTETAIMARADEKPLTTSKSIPQIGGEVVAETLSMKPVFSAQAQPSPRGLHPDVQQIARLAAARHGD
ncbi:MAG: hypothetical protein OXD29_11755, partial [Roseovarius sp.]|nr:hypothetical protein [Roseovarius sp.]